ncbi:hypothetical protein MJ390_09895 [Klebsiella pneumoniae]|nr:hypothetical protein MJ390_09895 [Klebsiella pneumoniae]
MLAQRRRAIAAGTEPLLCRAAAGALPGLRCCCAVIFAQVAADAFTRPAGIQTQYVNRHRRTWGRWKLPLLAASKSLRRSRKARAARMDAG